MNSTCIFETLILQVVNQGNFEQTDNPQIVMSQAFPKGEDDQIRKTRSKYEGRAVRKCDPQRQKSIWTEALGLKTRFGIPASDSLKGQHPHRDFKMTRCSV